MLKRHSEFLKSLLFIFDLSIICTCWVVAYYIRFSGLGVPVTKEVPGGDPVWWTLIDLGAMEEGGVHHAEDQSPVSAGVSPTEHRAGPVRAQPGGVGPGV